MNIVYFYSEVMGYTLSVIKSLVKDHGATVHVVYWDKGTRAAFQLPELKGVMYYKRSDLTTTGLEDLVERVSPEILYVSGRMDKGYLKASVKARRKGIVVVSGFDEQWKPTLKNFIIVAASYWLYKKYFDFMWVPGPYQYTFAKKMGYTDQQIIEGVYASDTTLFQEAFHTSSTKKQFIFTGRLAKEKGIHLLIDAFIASKKRQAHDWQLVLIGNGPLKSSIPSHSSIEWIDFLQPPQLLEKMKEGGVFVLPSTYEPWGVVIHDYASAGFPIICSDACGAAAVLVRNGENGYVFKSNDQEALTQALLHMINSTPSQLLQMKNLSHELSSHITPLHSANALLTVLNKKKSLKFP